MTESEALQKRVEELMRHGVLFGTATVTARRELRVGRCDHKQRYCEPCGLPMGHDGEHIAYRWLD